MFMLAYACITPYIINGRKFMWVWSKIGSGRQLRAYATQKLENLTINWKIKITMKIYWRFFPARQSAFPACVRES